MSQHSESILLSYQMKQLNTNGSILLSEYHMKQLLHCVKYTMPWHKAQYEDSSEGVWSRVIFQVVRNFQEMQFCSCWILRSLETWTFSNIICYLEFKHTPLLPLPSLAFLSLGLLKMRYSSRLLELVTLLCLLSPGGLAVEVRGEKRDT